MSRKPHESKHKKRRILLVDEHPLLRNGLIQLFEAERDLTVCGQADSGGAALRAIAHTKPDCILMGLQFRDMSGIELIKWIKRDHPRLPVLVLSAFEEYHFAERAFKAGAQGYVMKTEKTETVLTALRCALNGELYMSAQMTNHFARNFVTGRTPSENPASLLSERELGIFRLIGHGKGTAEIAGTLQISAKTVGAHREHIKEKLNLRNAAELLQRASEWVRRGLAILLGLLLFVSAVQLRYPSATRAPTASKRSCAPSHQFQSAFHFPVCRFGFAC